MKFKGSAWKFGADINTDDIIPAVYLTTTDPKELAKKCMEHEDPKFAPNVKKGDVIIAGKNFGCGSSREHAPIAIKGCGISCVIAPTFARIFYRNSFNMGLPILECDGIYKITKPGDKIEVDMDTGTVTNVTRKKSFVATPVPPFMQDLVKAGGLMNSIKKRGLV
jgi:3-isopropylmalate dehydratase small subunit